ncbi:MAG: HYR domain-containing protein, partial [Saprospiraceae bacterium]|nr:HYR domain-containing protein [Saprospiraceae bacterium]
MIWNFTTKVPKLLRLRAWLFALPLSILVNSSTLAQNPCKPITRNVTNAKSTNLNVFDDIGVVMTNFLNDQSQAGWLFEQGTTFTENGDGTATLKGSIKQFGDYAAPRRFKVNVILRGQTFRTPEGSPYNKTDVSTDTWYYYPTFEGELTGLDALEGGKITIGRYAKAAQIGIGANQIPDETLDQNANGAAFWFTWSIIAQPKTLVTRTDSSSTPNGNALIFNPFDENKNIADMAFLVSGTPSIPCGECLAKAAKVKTGQLHYTLNSNGVVDVAFEQSSPNTVPQGYKVLYLLTQKDNQIVQSWSEKPTFHICDTGKFCIHVLVYDPKTVDTSKFVVNTTRGIDIAAEFKERGGNICGSYDFDGTCINVSRCVAKAGTVKLETTVVSLEKDNGALISGKPTTDSNVPNGYKVLYVLTKGSNLVIMQASETPQFRVKDTGDYRVHTFVYDPATLNLNVIVLTQTKASEVLPLLFENGGSICASLNVQGTKVVVKNAPNPCINDIVPPVFTFCPPNKRIELDGAMCIPVSWEEPTATDNCCTPTLTYISTPNGLKNGDPFHPGVSTITYSAKDCAGNITLCQFD